MLQMTACFLPHPQRGGVWPRFGQEMWQSHIPLSFSFLSVYSLLIGLPHADPGKFERTRATPPQKWGVMWPR